MWRGRGRGRRGRGGRSRGGFHSSLRYARGGQPTNNKKWERDSSKDEEDDSNTSRLDTLIGASVPKSAATDSSNKSVSGYTWKRQSHNTRSSSYTPVVSAVNKTNTWKRQLAEDSSKQQSNSSNGDGCNNDIGNNFLWKSSDMTAQKQIQHGRKRKHASTKNGPRRINLLTNSMLHEEEAGGDTTKISKKRGKDAADANGEVLPTPKTLTDFCYQDTCPRGSGYGRRGVRSGGRTTITGGNIGIVRVKPNKPSSTPICPTFRRGLPCNNPTCKLRHDVSTEASLQICVFFQRNGMCSKGDDCPFRHVKVAWDTEVCPMFQKLGYCENKDCLLRHVDAKKPTTSASPHAKEHTTV